MERERRGKRGSEREYHYYIYYGGKDLSKRVNEHKKKENTTVEATSSTLEALNKMKEYHTQVQKWHATPSENAYKKQTEHKREQK